MARTLPVEIRVADLPQVKEALTALKDERDSLRDLLQQWEPRIRCPQCGCRYCDVACGPTHALVAHMVSP